MRSFLDQYSTQVWRDVTTARQIQMVPFGEVAVTDRLHLRTIQGMLAATGNGHGGLRSGISYDPTAEKVTGADWEWVVQIPGIPGPPRYLTYRIQAKILTRIPVGTPPSLKFSSIGQRSGAQLRDLIADAATIGAIPLYCFYIGDPWPNAAAIGVPKWAGKIFPREQFGATVVPAERVKHVYDNRKRASTNANSYLEVSAATGVHDADLRHGVGRRLSDLFPTIGRPGGGGAPGPGGGGAPGPGGGRAPGPGDGRAPGPGDGRAPGPGDGRAPGPGDGEADQDELGAYFREESTDLTQPEQAAYRREIDEIREENEPGQLRVRRADNRIPGRPARTFYMLARD